MQLYPAIDIKGGQCVRLTQGLFDNVKVYSDTPADMARMWRDQGATFLHLVDLDGALAGRSVNEAVIRSIVEAIDIPVEIGGGIRTAEAVRNMLDLGVARVDARDGLVAIQGWEELSSVTARELCLKMKELGVLHIVYTDIARDGMLNGPNVEATRELTMDTGLDIIASGGVSSMEDLRRLYDAGIQGAIIGKALYENRVDLREAVRAFQTDRTGNGL